MLHRLMAHLVTRTQLARVTLLIHRHKPFLTTISSLSQFSTKTRAWTASNRRPPTLPDELSRNVVFLSCKSAAKGGLCHVYLVGVTHLSEESTRQVQAIVKFLKPQVVFLELCESRVGLLALKNLKVPTTDEMITMLKKKHNMFEVIYSCVQAEVASKRGVIPGSEFRVAYEEAIKYGGRVTLGDRPIQLKKNDDSDRPNLLIRVASKEFPTLMETVVHERDRYMATTLLQVASRNSLVVAVVGKGHLQGIKKHWKKTVWEDLMSVPSPKPAVSAIRILTSVGVAVAGVAIVSGIYISWKK
ncbi:traB domain-containing protein isoform X2 [Cajanus cajan]|uniref:traB domain-containing protein isoform X2 n=1 Tax=Cajanus cajan TaxID=3821 RepID=UPI00098DB147|nr:traB domain-containing protein isoform X2 [Cajanus cajan]